MGNYWIAAAIVLTVLVAAAALAWRRLAARHTLRRRALLQFAEQRSSLAERMLEVAGAAGKPRGLRWLSTELTGPPVFAVDAGDGTVYALVGVTIRFEAIEGGGMEDVEAVDNLRSATAVFVHRQGNWTTDGRVIFNLEPLEAVGRFNAQLRPLELEEYL